MKKPIKSKEYLDHVKQMRIPHLEHLSHFEQRIHDHDMTMKSTLLTLLNSYLSSEVCRNSTPEQNKIVAEDMEMIISFVDHLHNAYSIKE